MATNTTPEKTNQDQQTFLILRKSIGYLGIVFPLAVFLGSLLFSDCDEGLSSISAYYHSNMRDVFVSVICVIGVFLFTYRGHNSTENLAGNFACLFAFGIAFLPTEYPEKDFCMQCTRDTVKIHPTLHGISATAFFLILTYFAWVLFPKNEERHPDSDEKVKRIKTYKTCAVVMLISIILIAVHKFFFQENESIARFDPVFYLEWAALWAFGVSWIVRGGAFLEG